MTCIDIRLQLAVSWKKNSCIMLHGDREGLIDPIDIINLEPINKRNENKIGLWQGMDLVDTLKQN